MNTQYEILYCLSLPIQNIWSARGVIKKHGGSSFLSMPQQGWWRWGYRDKSYGKMRMKLFRKQWTFYRGFADSESMRWQSSAQLFLGCFFHILLRDQDPVQKKKEKKEIDSSAGTRGGVVKPIRSYMSHLLPVRDYGYHSSLLPNASVTRPCIPSK